MIFTDVHLSDAFVERFGDQLAWCSGRWLSRRNDDTPCWRQEPSHNHALGLLREWVLDEYEDADAAGRQGWNRYLNYSGMSAVLRLSRGALERPFVPHGCPVHGNLAKVGRRWERDTCLQLGSFE